jgi:phage terminase small subunit
MTRKSPADSKPKSKKPKGKKTERTAKAAKIPSGIKIDNSDTAPSKCSRAGASGQAKAAEAKKPRVKRNEGLTVKQEKFAHAYVETGNATEAYRRAYNCGKMKPASISRKAFEVLENGKVTAYIDALRAKHAERHELTVDLVIGELRKIGFSDIRKIIKWGKSMPVLDAETGELTFAHGVAMKSSEDIDDETAAAISEISQSKDGTLKVKLYDKKGALVDLGKHLGMFPAQVSGEINHKHTHTVEPVSDSLAWLAGMLGGASDREASLASMH